LILFTLLFFCFEKEGEGRGREAREGDEGGRRGREAREGGEGGRRGRGRGER